MGSHVAFGYPDPFVRLILAIHVDMPARAIHHDVRLEEFSIFCGLNQGCVLFFLCLAAIFHGISPDDPAVVVKCRFEGSLFNFARL